MARQYIFIIATAVMLAITPKIAQAAEVTTEVTTNDEVDEIIGMTENDDGSIVFGETEDLEVEVLVQEWANSEYVDPAAWLPVTELELKPDQTYLIAVRCKNVSDITYERLSLVLEVPSEFTKGEERELAGFLVAEEPMVMQNLKVDLNAQESLSLKLPEIEQKTAQSFVHNTLVTPNQQGNGYNFTPLSANDLIVTDNGEEYRSFTMSGLPNHNLAPSEEVAFVYLFETTALEHGPTFEDLICIFLIIIIVGGFIVGLLLKISHQRQQRKHDCWHHW